MKQEDVVADKASVLDYFAIFEIERTIFVDLDDLEEKYNKLQILYNNFSNSIESERNLIVINNGFQTLSNQKMLVQYVRKLLNIQDYKDFSIDELDFFLEKEDSMNQSENPKKEIDELKNCAKLLLIKINNELFTKKKSSENVSKIFSQYLFISKIVEKTDDILNIL